MSASAQENARQGDSAYRCWYDFLNRLHGLANGDVLEIGSRARSGVTRRALVAKQLKYVGLDIRAGENVDVVGDAHALSELFARDRFAAIFAVAVFEHLAMPWKVVVEMNRVLAVGGLVFIQTPQSWPLHDQPCDFWRFSTDTWRTSFNEHTGFEILETAQGEPARVVPRWDAPVLHGIPLQPSYLNSTVLARKVGDAKVDWPVPLRAATEVQYPH
jgi:SAM-dependent methyltransferase